MTRNGPHPVTTGTRLFGLGCPLHPRMCHGQSGYQGRKYYTKEEKKAWLEDYASELENELKAVRERLVEVKAEAEA